jgi:hypothetical protein
VYEYPKIIRRASGDMNKQRRFNIPAKTINKSEQEIVKTRDLSFLSDPGAESDRMFWDCEYRIWHPQAC